MSEDKKDEKKVKAALARKDALEPEQRRQIAIKAARARWGERPLSATHRGSFEKDFGIDVECYVLDDEQKTAVISQRGMGEAIGLGSSGSRLPQFIQGERIAPYVGRELAEKLANPLVFQWTPAGANSPLPSIVNGYDVTILIDLCKVIVRAHADRRLLPRQEHVARQASIILSASAKAGIKGLVYALAGYDAPREEVLAAFKMFVREEARDYEREFPPLLYAEWYRLYELPRPERNNPWKFKSLTLEHVYKPLARSNGRILNLARTKRAESGERKKKLHQFLAEVGVKALRTHLGQLLGIAQVSSTKEEYEKFVGKIFAAQIPLDLEDEE